MLSRELTTARAALAAGAIMAVLAAASGDAHQAAYAMPYMAVSADDVAFGGTFAGSMVVEVVVRDPAIRSIGEPAGEPSVLVDGEPLRMVQGADGSWYAYFADVDAAMAADAAAAGAAGKGMDFGVFCAPSADGGVLGASFEYADAVAVARSVGGGSNGVDAPTECGGPIGGELLNNVVRRPPSVSGEDGPNPGQIGINPDAWPVVQLYSLGRSVDVEYRGTGGTERAELVYDEIPNAAMSLERDRYPAGAEVYVSIADAQLNQDPTDRDVWTFSTDPDDPAVFYMGGWDGKDMPPAVDLHPHLRAIGFEENGVLTIDAGRTVAFKPNGLQSASTIMAIGGGTYSSLVTVRESAASSSEFASYDGDGASTVWVPRDAPRGTAAVFEYNDARMSALTGPSTATVGIGTQPAAGGGGQAALPGTRNTVTITDADRNTNPSKRDVLSASGAEAVPFVRMGTPLTIDGTGGVWWLGADGGRAVPAAYSVLDAGRIDVDRPAGAATGADTLIIDAGYGAGDMRRLQGGPSDRMTTWLNYDVRSLAGPNGRGGATIGIVFVGAGDAVASAAAERPAESWDVSDGQGTLRVAEYHGNMNGAAAFVVGIPGGIVQDADDAVVHIDLFTFGADGRGKVANNAMYRLELEETGANTGVFDGTIEHVVIDGRNAADPGIAASLEAYGDDVRIAVSGGGGRSPSGGGIAVEYTDVGGGGGTGRPVAAATEAPSHMGSVHFSAASYGIGRPVTLTLIDPDLNTDHARVETYGVVDDPASPYVDAIAPGGSLLLEVTIKGERYSRCVIDGTEYGGLASSGFSLVETGPATGVFAGAFKMPQRICNADGTALVSPAGGRIDARYIDYAYGEGWSRVVGATPYGSSEPARHDGSAGGGGGSAGGGGSGGTGGGGGLGTTSGPAGGVSGGGTGQEYIHGYGRPSCHECPDEDQPAGWPEAGSLQVPPDARHVAMAKGEWMSDDELFHVVQSVVKAATAGGEWRPPPASVGDGGGTTAAPAWYKGVAGWWGDGLLPDAEFAVSARYVLDVGLVRLPR